MRKDLFPEFTEENQDKYDNEKTTIILLGQDPALVRECVDTLVKNTENLPEILLGHTDRFYSLFEGRFPECRLFDLGYWNYSKNNNYLASQTDAGKLIFMNDDIFVAPGWLEPMLEALDNPEVGEVGIQLRFPSEKIQHAGVIYKDNRADQPVHAYIGSPVFSKNVNSPAVFPAVTAACIGMKHSLFDAIGGFNEDYLVEVQDVDLSVKVWAYGKKVLYIPNSVAYHLTAETRKDNTSYKIIAKDRKLLKDRTEQFCKEYGFIK